MDDAGLHELALGGSRPPGGGFMDGLQGQMNGVDEGEDMIPHDFVSVARGRNYANWLPVCPVGVKLICEIFDPKTPAFQSGGEEIFVRMTSEVSAYVQSKGTLPDSPDFVQLLNSPIPPRKIEKRRGSRVHVREPPPEKKPRRIMGRRLMGYGVCYTASSALARSTLLGSTDDRM